jgi:hypothetical protein
VTVELKQGGGRESETHPASIDWVIGVSGLLKHIQYMVSQLKGFTPTNFMSRYTSNRDSVLNQAEKQLASRVRFSSIKSEGKFVQVIIQMGRADRSVMCAEQPSLQERCPAVYQRQKVLSDISRLTHNGMLLPLHRQAPIASPPISAHQTAEFHAIFDCHSKNHESCGVSGKSTV